MTPSILEDDSVANDDAANALTSGRAYLFYLVCEKPFCRVAGRLKDNAVGPPATAGIQADHR